MSGWVGVVRFDAAPIDRDAFDAFASSIRWRGPDGWHTWQGEGAAFAHALLIASPAAENERMPAVKGDAVLCGDVRIDGREELAAKLGISARAADSVLLLAAWERWGDALTDHLIGDFSFALWDAAIRRLLLVRDHFARRPLFYARIGDALLVTNDLAALIAVPRLTDELDEQAIGDFLLFGRNLHAERTTFANVRRVPAAHRAIVTAGAMRVERYWSIPWRDEPRRIRERDAHAEFRDLFSRAVSDRLPNERVVVSLSGGLDSNAVAATIANLHREGRTRVEPHALTTVWRKDVRDEEGEFAALAANAYGMPIEWHVADGCEAFAGWDDPRVCGLEPTDEPCSRAFYDFAAQAAKRGRVVLTGEGGDPLLYNSHEHFFRMLTRLHFVRFFHETGRYLLTRRKRPPLNLRSQFLRAVGRSPGLPEYPSWIAADLERRLHLRERWREVLVPTSRLHPYRNEAARLLDSASWARTFEVTDAGATGHLLEWRSPYFDVRLVELLFSLPPMPYFAEKDLVRESLRGAMPEAIRSRPKRALPRDPSALAFASRPEAWIRHIAEAPTVAPFVDRRNLTQRLRGDLRDGNDYLASQQAFAVGLAIWLTTRKR